MIGFRKVEKHVVLRHERNEHLDIMILVEI